MAMRKHCDHCGTEITKPLVDVAAIEPVANSWPGGNFMVRVVLCGVRTTKGDEYPTEEPGSWPRLDLCQHCFGYVLEEATRALLPDRGAD